MVITLVSSLDECTLVKRIKRVQEFLVFLFLLVLRLETYYKIYTHAFLFLLVCLPSLAFTPLSDRWNVTCRFEAFQSFWCPSRTHLLFLSIFRRPALRYLGGQRKQNFSCFCHALSCLVFLSSCLVLSCLVLSCLVLSCLVLSCLVLSCLV
jgi:hypothetical protein